MSRLQTIIDWTRTARRHSPQFDNDASALLTRLQMLQAQEQALLDARSAPASIGLYGHSREAKAYLLQILCGSGERLTVSAGNKTLDYLTHINPGHELTRMALRFSPRAQKSDDAFPLRLILMSEAELVQVFLDNALSQPALRHVEKSVIRARLDAWQSLRQTQPVSGICENEVAAIARFWEQRVPARLRQFDDDLWQQMIALLPYLDLSARASAWGLLWGEQQTLTRQWLYLAHTLQQTGNAREVTAPLSLLVDSFSLPVTGFLTPDSEAEGEIVVHPQVDGAVQRAISLPVSALSLLTVELILPVHGGALDGVDVLDIPVAPEHTDAPLWATKCRWLLERYRQRLQPDLLLICNATRTRGQIPASARRLVRWSNDTQPARDGALPGLVWTITPQDDRFSRGVNLDEAVQRLIEQPGQRWGTLQALESSSLQRLIEWLAQATADELRQARLAQIADDLWQQTRQLMSPFCHQPERDAAAARQQAEEMVRELQSRAAILGELLEGLLPPQRYFEHLGQAHQPREEKVSDLFSERIDLFSPEAPPSDERRGHQDRGSLAHALWIKHLRHWSHSDANTARFGLPSATLQNLANVLAVASYRLDLTGRLQAITPDDRTDAAQLRATIGNWLAWLGYAEVPPEQRPPSCIAKGSTLFAPLAVQHDRLTRLGDAPEHAATRYVYDWLVALFIRATEAPDYHSPLALSLEARSQLSALL